MAEVHDRIQNNLKVLVPAAGDAVINLQIFNTVDDLARNVLFITPPTSAAAAITTWMTEPQYQEHFQTIIHGAAWRLYVEPGKPWSSDGLAKVHLELYNQHAGRAVIDAATATTGSITDRILDNLRVKLPGVRTGAMTLELFNIVDELAREALYITPPASGAPMSDWLTTEQYETHYRLLIDGALARLYAQPGQTYSSLELAKVHMGLYEQQLAVARVDHATTDAIVAITGTLMDTLRIRLPGAKDGALQLELGNTIDEICRYGDVYQEILQVHLIMGQTQYTITPTDKEIIKLFQVIHDTLDLTEAVYDAGELSLAYGPLASDTTLPMFVHVSLVPEIAGTDWVNWLPERLWKGLYQTLIDGVCFRMMTQLGKQYSNPKMAVYHGKRFRSAISSVRYRASQGDLTGGQNWVFPRFAR